MTEVRRCIEKQERHTRGRRGKKLCRGGGSPLSEKPSNVLSGSHVGLEFEPNAVTSRSCLADVRLQSGRVSCHS